VNTKIKKTLKMFKNSQNLSLAVSKLRNLRLSANLYIKRSFMILLAGKGRD